jgi:large subunit ribosomal protein L18
MKVQKRRRRESKTDYLKRLNLLKSGKPRVAMRKTNKYIIAQYIVSKEARDSIKIGLSSKKLLKLGWPKESAGGLKSISAAYLTGYLIGREIIKQKLDTPIVDLGMQRVLYKTRIYGFIKGLIDSGVKIKCKEEAFPPENRISGEHMKNKVDINEIKSQIDSK